MPDRQRLHNMPRFEHLRHKPPTPLDQPRELIVVYWLRYAAISMFRTSCALAGCVGVTRVICCGQAKIDDKIARDGADNVKIEVHRTLPPVLKKLKQEEGFELVGLEQTTNSEEIHTISFNRKMALVVGNERLGLTPEELQWIDRVAEIPVWGMPFSYNVHTATAMAAL